MVKKFIDDAIEAGLEGAAAIKKFKADQRVAAGKERLVRETETGVQREPTLDLHQESIDAAIPENYFDDQLDLLDEQFADLTGAGLSEEEQFKHVILRGQLEEIAKKANNGGDTGALKSMWLRILDEATSTGGGGGW